MTVGVGVRIDSGELDCQQALSGMSGFGANEDYPYLLTSGAQEPDLGD